VNASVLNGIHRLAGAEDEEVISVKGNDTRARSVVRDVHVGTENYVKIKGAPGHFARDGRRKLRQTFERALDALKGLENDVGVFRAEDLEYVSYDLCVVAAVQIHRVITSLSGIDTAGSSLREVGAITTTKEAERLNPRSVKGVKLGGENLVSKSHGW